jgi:hypothetical protein
MPNDLRLLAGEWSGSYESEQSGRSGTILFVLSATADSAYGYVLMKPAVKPHIVGYKSSRGFWREASTSSKSRLTISFVGVEEGRVRGTLDRYVDPDCGCTLNTTFVGRIEGDLITGTYKTLHLDTGSIQRGEWTATRKRA